MSFSPTQIRKLQQDLDPDCIRTREIHGRQMSYIEGWHAIAEANRIFGFDAWNRETVESRCVLSRESKGTFQTVYVAKVRVSVRTSETTIIREGYGTGDAQAPSAGEAHDKAIKTAETDATKRAFATFGKPFGLSLYLGTRQKPKAPIERRRTLQNLGPNGRYFVPSRPKPLIDPALLSVAGQSNDNGILNGEAAAEPLVAVTAAATAREEPQSPSLSSQPMLITHPKRHRDADHLRFVASQPCLVCSRTPADAHHLKFAQPHAMSKKVSDEFTVPLCRTHHSQLHHGGDEVAWWIDMDIDPLPIAQDLWLQSKHGTSKLHISELPASEPHASKPDASKSEDGE